MLNNNYMDIREEIYDEITKFPFARSYCNL